MTTARLLVDAAALVLALAEIEVARRRITGRYVVLGILAFFAPLPAYLTAVARGWRSWLELDLLYVAVLVFFSIGMRGDWASAAPPQARRDGYVPRRVWDRGLPALMWASLAVGLYLVLEAWLT